MSEQSNTPPKSAASTRNWRDAMRARVPLYAGAAVILALTLAYVDAGEEPLRPITQPIALGGGGQ